MTLQEVCQKFGFSESYVKKNFKKVQQRLLKKQKIRLQKIGRGDKATYQIKEDNSRALTLFTQEKKTVMLYPNSMIQLPLDMDFATFLGIFMTPFEVFRGSYKDFLAYIQMNQTDSNVEKLKASLETLQKQDYIHYVVDKTNSNYFFAGIYRKIEEQLSLGTDMIQTCRRLQLKYNKKSWVPLLKYWLGIKYLYIKDEEMAYTRKDLSQLTGLTLYQITECGKILENDNVFRSDKVYADYRACLGKRYTLNVIHEGNEL